MPMMQTRRRFLTTLSLAGAAGLVGPQRAFAMEGALETTTVRLANLPGICIAPQYVAEELLRAEGFADGTGPRPHLSAVSTILPSSVICGGINAPADPVIGGSGSRCSS